MLRSNRVGRLMFISWLVFLPIILLYHNIFDNPFIHDDFLWLDSGKKISEGDFGGLFTLGAGRYFPTVVHLLYGLSFKLFGLNYTWYHGISLITHITNSILLFCLIYLLFHNYLWALLASFFFAINPVISNAIIWPSAWVDLFAATGFLTSLIFYKLFLDKRFKWLYVLAFLCFMVSIFSKVTGIGLPLLLLFLEIVTTSPSGHNMYKQIFRRMSPFFLTSLFYLIPIIQGAFKGLISRPSEIFYNAIRYISLLFLPEEYLTYTRFLLPSFILIISLLLLYLRRKEEIMFILLLMIVSLLPLTTLSFSLKPVMLIDSISHRLYLPAISSQALIGLLVSKAYLSNVVKPYKKFVTGPIILLCLFSLTWSYSAINQREKAWDSDSKHIFSLLQQIKSKKERFPPDTLICIINVPSSEAFWEPMIRLYYNDDLIEVRRYPSPAEVSRFQNVYIWLYMGGRLFDDHLSIIPYAKFIETKDFSPLLKFYELKGWDKEKIELLNTISASAFNDANIHFLLAKIYKDMKMIGEAEAEYRAALIISPFNIKVRYELGLLYIEERQYSNAINELMLVARNESDPLALMARKFIEYAKDKIDSSGRN